MFDPLIEIFKTLVVKLALGVEVSTIQGDVAPSHVSNLSVFTQ